MSYGLNRTLCDVFSDMRKAVATLNFSYMSSLIEEAQMMGNRMEAGLYDKHDYEILREKIRELKSELKDLKVEKVEKVEKALKASEELSDEKK